MTRCVRPEESGDEMDLHQAIPDERQQASSDLVENSELHQLIADKITLLPERQQKILALYYFEGMRMGDIAKIFGFSQARICQLHLKAVDFLRNECLALT